MYVDLQNVPDLVLTCVGANTQGVRCRIIAVLNFAMFTSTTLMVLHACQKIRRMAFPSTQVVWLMHECKDKHFSHKAMKCNETVLYTNIIFKYKRERLIRRHDI